MFNLIDEQVLLTRVGVWLMKMKLLLSLLFLIGSDTDRFIETIFLILYYVQFIFPSFS
jgi:hypothetical protein